MGITTREWDEMGIRNQFLQTSAVNRGVCAVSINNGDISPTHGTPITSWQFAQRRVGSLVLVTGRIQINPSDGCGLDVVSASSWFRNNKQTGRGGARTKNSDPHTLRNSGKGPDEKTDSMGCDAQLVKKSKLGWINIQGFLTCN